MTLIRDGAVAEIRLDRPAVLNALDPAMAAAFLAACREVAGDTGVRAVLLSGAGRAFMAGGDVATFRAAGGGVRDHVHALIGTLHEALLLLAGMAAPSIAVVQGVAAGAGLSLALATDLAIAAEDARFVLAYGRLATSPDGGSTWALPRLIGLRRAMGLALLDETLDAPAALAAGLVNRIVPAARLAEEARALAQRLAGGPTHAFGATKALLRASLERGYADQLAAEREAFAACSTTADFAEGVGAFLDKRPAVFRGV